MTYRREDSRFRIIAFAMLSVCLLVGCPKQAAPPPAAAAKPFVGTTVTIAVPAGRNFAANWKILLDEWSEQTGAAVEIREFGGTADDPRLAGALVATFGNPPVADADLLIFSPVEFGELAADDRLATLADDEQSLLGQLDWIDIFQGLRLRAASLQKKPAIVPLSSPVLVCYYRRDLLEKVGLAPPQTWSDYQQLLDTLDQWAPGMTAVEPWGEEFRATMFLARAAAYVKHPENFSVFFDISRGQPLIDSPGFVRALETTRAAVVRLAAEVKDYTPADCRREFFAGKAALAVTFETGVNPQQAVTVKRPEGMRVGVTRLPGVREIYNLSTKSWSPVSGEEAYRVTLTGFGGLCGGVSAKSSAEAAQAAWSLLATLSIDRFESAFGETSHSPTRKSQSGHPDFFAGAELAGEEQVTYVDVAAAALQDENLIAELPFAVREEFRKALTDALGKLLVTAGDAGSKDASPADAQAVLHGVAEEWRNITQRVGPDRVLNSYRRILGLPPLRVMSSGASK